MTAVSRRTFESFMDSPFPGKYHNTFWHDILHHQQWHCPFSDKAFSDCSLLHLPALGPHCPEGKHCSTPKVLPKCQILHPFIISCWTESQEGRRPGWPKVTTPVKGLRVSQGSWTLAPDQFLQFLSWRKKAARESYPCMRECHRSSKY